MSLTKKRFRNFMAGDGLRARALRGTLVTFLGFGSQQFLRLLSNLILTRLLFPEAFGLMALVTIVLTGLQMLSDTGFQTAIVQSRRGDEPSFLNTAWTMQIARGIFLGIVAGALSVPLARFYEEPQLALLLPVAGLNAVILGATSTKLWVANRHLLLGRITMIELSCQIFGIVLTIGLAWVYKSVWALLVGMLFSSVLKVIFSHAFLPGQSNKVQWNKNDFRELFHFGKYLFLSSAAGFVINNADRAILGKFLSMAGLGIYNIGYFPASVPLMLSRQLGTRILLPLYTKAPPSESSENRRKLRKARLLLAGGLIGLGLFLGLIGEIFVSLLYDGEYTLAGPVMVLLSISCLPTISIGSYDMLLLAQGSSKQFSIKLVLTAITQTALLFFSVQNWGAIGAVIAPPVATIFLYPLIAHYAHREGGWDPLLDFFFLVIIASGAAGVLWFNNGSIAAVLGSS